MNDLLQTKQALHQLCRDYIQERIDRLNNDMQAAQSAANEETKSSAGDKYETGRAMMQLEKEKTAGQLSEALKLRKVLDELKAERAHSVVEPGSLVLTNQGNYYLSISAGKLAFEDKEYFAVSAASPIGKQLVGLRKGEEMTFNGRKIQVLQIV